MADLPLRPCAHPGCPELTRETYCAAHKPAEAPRRESAEWHRLYFTRRWKKLRERQLLIEPYCAECAKKGMRTRATDVDHIRPHRGIRRLFYDSDNLQSLCHSCHSEKTMKERMERAGNRAETQGELSRVERG